METKKPQEEADDGTSGFDKSFTTYNSKFSPNSAIVSVSTENVTNQIDQNLLPLVGKSLINLCRFDRSTFKLKDIIFTYVVSQIMTLEQRKYLSQVFKAMDRDQDGRLNISDINQTLELAYDTCKNEFKQEHKDDQDNIETIELTLEDVKGLIQE